MKKVYVNAQWQGGADRSTYDGAEELRKYLPGQDFVALPVSTDQGEMVIKKNGITGSARLVFLSICKLNKFSD